MVNCRTHSKFPGILDHFTLVALLAMAAAVTSLGLTSEEKAPEPMIGFADAITYGNYLRMPNAGQYRIKVSVRQPQTDSQHPLTADFLFDRKQD